MTTPPPTEPIEERPATWLENHGGAAGERAASSLRRVGGYDRALYRSVARLPTPWLDEPLRRVSDFADYSKPWILVAGALALFGGPKGRHAAVAGLASVGTTSLVVNQPMKLAGAGSRPDRDALGVPAARRVHMPTSASFPSGHSASAAAFVVAVGDVLPVLRLPLRVAAAIVAFSRVYTGVHYPSDVLVGTATGALAGRLVPRGVRRIQRNRR